MAGFLAVLCQGRLAVAQPIITEFMASNASTFEDDDGESSDWVEIYNPDASPVSLLGYALTNEEAVPKKWLFPNVTIPAGGFIVVFASEKDRRNPATALHTTFKLPITGGFLALTAPGGEFLTSFDPFPLQETDFSYGFTQNATYHDLLEAGAPAVAVVPASGSLGLTWTQTTFNAAGWTSGRTGIGYDRNPDYGPLIQLDLRAAMDGLATSAYIRVPFSSADPGALSALFLSVKYDDGFVAYLNGQKVAERNAPAAPAWDSAATTLHDDAQALVFEEINISQHVSALRAGANVLAIHGLNESASSSDFLILPELRAIEAGAPELGEAQFFAVPSPGWANTTGFAGVSVPPEFSVAGGTFTTGFSLALSSPVPGATIRYTLDRSLPTAASSLYTAPLPLQATTVVRARAFEPGLAPSKVVSEIYTFLDASARNFTSNLPLVVINTFGQGVGENAYTTIHAHVIDTAANGRSALAGTPAFTGTAALKIRGSSSLGFPKRSFNFEIRDESGDDLDVSLLGMPAESDWVLYAPYTDKTLMRDVLAYEWSNDIGRYAPRTRFVELYMAGGGQRLTSADYQGVYVLEEKIKRGSDRVDITELHPSDSTAPAITGGYILKVDRLDPGDSGFSTTSGLTIAYVDPKEEDITPAQASWIRSHMNQFEAALFSPGYRDPVTGYRRYIDLDSWVDHFLLVELTKNIDGYRLSTFFHKDRDGKLVMGPAWDYNLTLGNADYLTGWDPAGWYVDQLDFPWWDRLIQDPDFVQRFIDRWGAFRTAALSRDRLIQTVDVKVALLGESQARNYQKWPILGSYVWPNWYIGQSYADEINFMTGWTSNRLAWIDGNYAAQPRFNQHGGPITPGFRLTMAVPIGPVYYTLDGSDPRLPGGTLLASALTYSAPVELDRNTRVLARARTTKGWSALTAATFHVDLPPIAITEIMYHAADPEEESAFGDNDFEFIEVRNAGGDFADLRGVKLTGAVQFDFTGSDVEVLGPGEYAVVVENLAAFATRYETAGIFIAGEYSGDLGNSSEEILLEGPVGEPIQRFTYSDAWYPETDGLGRSLALVDPEDPRQDMGNPARWRPSLEVGGSPGRPDEDLQAGLQVPGDGNQDGSLDLSDPLFLLNFLFGGTVTELPCNAGGNQILFDVNGSGDVDISDAVFGLLYLFAGGGPPALGTECTPVTGCPESCSP